MKKLFGLMVVLGAFILGACGPRSIYKEDVKPAMEELMSGAMADPSAAEDLTMDMLFSFNDIELTQDEFDLFVEEFGEDTDLVASAFETVEIEGNAIEVYIETPEHLDSEMKEAAESFGMLLPILFYSNSEYTEDYTALNLILNKNGERRATEMVPLPLPLHEFR